MSSFSLISQKEIPIKITHYKSFKIGNNINVISNSKSNRPSKIRNFSKYNNNEIDSKLTEEINKTRFLTEKNVSKIAQLYRFNSSNQLTNYKNENHSFKNQSQNHSKRNIQIILSNSNSNSLRYTSQKDNLQKKKLNKMFNKNLINFDDRRKIKKLNSDNDLRLYGIYLQRKSQNLRIDEIMPLNRTFFNQNIETENNYIANNYNIKDNNSSYNSYSNNQCLKIYNPRKNKKKRKYTLNELMKLNPYHLVPEKVIYNDSVETEKISEKLLELNSSKINIKKRNKSFFFKNSNMKNNRLGKMVNSFFVQLNGKITYETDFVWRILSIIYKAQGFSPFYTACIFKGYHELWKNYSILLEQLLVKYPLFKWFFDKNKYMKEEVFNEFISCLKIGTNNDESFTTKIFLLFGENNLINIKLFLLIMKLTSNSDEMVEKVNFFVELLTDLKQKNEINNINLVELFNIFRNIFNSSNYKKDIKYFLETLKKEFNNGKTFDHKIYINKNQMRNLFLNNIFLQKKLKEFINKFEKADKNYEEQINQHFYDNASRLTKILSDENQY